MSTNANANPNTTRKFRLKPEVKGAAISVLAVTVVAAATITGFRMSSTEHKMGSRLSQSVNRELLITAEDGREIFYYTGSSPIVIDHEKRYVIVYDEYGRQCITYYGITDTVQVGELEAEGKW